MQVPWEALAEAFLYNVRRLIEDVCAARVAEGRLLPEEAARHRESPAVYRIVLEGLRMGTLTTASDRERFLDPVK